MIVQTRKDAPSRHNNGKAKETYTLINGNIMSLANTNEIDIRESREDESTDRPSSKNINRIGGDGERREDDVMRRSDT